MVCGNTQKLLQAPQCWLRMSNQQTLLFLELSTTQSTLGKSIYGKLQKVPFFSFGVQYRRNSLSKISLGIFEFVKLTEIFTESLSSSDVFM